MRIISQRTLAAALAGCFCLIYASTSSAAIDSAITRRFATFHKLNHYLSDGVFTGGHSSLASNSFSILNMRRIFAKKQKIERVLISLGDDKGHTLLNRVSYFQVSIDKNHPRIVVNLAQTVASNINQQKLKRIFLSSQYVKNAKINFDPTDLSMTVQLFLKKPVQLEVFEIKSKTHASRVVLDMKG